jgi:hypothetical protein
LVPAVAREGVSDVAVGAGSDEGAVTEKLTAFETAEPFDTVIETDPWFTMSVYGTRAVSCVELTKVVLAASGELPQFTTEPPFTKFVPFTVSVKPAGLQAGVEADDVVEADTEVIVGVGGGAIVNGAGEVVPPPGGGVKTVTFAVPATRKSAAGTVASTSVALT